ncbi:MAG: hypothetical protein RR034_05265 [Bacteroidales bacterium]
MIIVHEIDPKHGTSLQLAKEFSVSPEWVCKCCSGKSNSHKAKSIRQRAYELNGRLIRWEEK